MRFRRGHADFSVLGNTAAIYYLFVKLTRGVDTCLLHITSFLIIGYAGRRLSRLDTANTKAYFKIGNDDKRLGLLPAIGRRHDGASRTMTAELRPVTFNISRSIRHRPYARHIGIASLPFLAPFLAGHLAYYAVTAQHRASRRICRRNMRLWAIALLASSFRCHITQHLTTRMLSFSILLAAALAAIIST